LELVENVFRENGEYQGLEFKARTLKDNGKNAAEKRYVLILLEFYRSRFQVLK
jgi:hypothetical protein